MVTTAVLTDSTGPRGASVSTGAESQRAVSQANAELLTGAVELHALREAVAGMDAAEREAEAIDRIRALEELKATCAAAQARESAALDTLRRARRPLRACRRTSRAEGSGPRSPWPAASPHTRVDGTSGWPGRCAGRCPTR